MRKIRSEEHTSELQSQSTIAYAVFCLEKDWVLVIILFLIFFGIPIYLFIRYILEMLGIVKPRPKSNQRNQSRRRNNDDDWIPPFFMGGGGSSGGGFSGGSFGGGTFSGGGSGGGW